MYKNLLPISIHSELHEKTFQKTIIVYELWTHAESFLGRVVDSKQSLCLISPNDTSLIRNITNQSQVSVLISPVRLNSTQ